MRSDLRSEQREEVALPVLLENGSAGVTRDLSASGVYIELGDHPELGGEVDLTIEVSMDKQDVLLKCRGQIVRVERKDGRIGIAVRMLDPRIEPLSAAPFPVA